MQTSPRAAILLQAARRQAGLTQRELALRANTSQSVVARVERGQTDPGHATLARLVEAAGFRLISKLAPHPAEGSHMLEDVDRILAMTPEERLTEVGNLNRFISQAHRE